jgi:hypothetical protein
LQFVIIIKYVFQFKFYPWSQKLAVPVVDTTVGSWLSILGLEQRDDYAIYDLILLMSLFFHRYMLKV